MVYTGGHPCSTLLIFGESLLDDIKIVSMMQFNIIDLIDWALLEGSIVNTISFENVGDGPLIVIGLNKEYRYCDVVEKVWWNKTFPFLVWVSLNTILIGGIYSLVWDLHKILLIKLSVWLCLRVKTLHILKHSWIRGSEIDHK